MKLLVTRAEANEVREGSATIREYFSQVIPSLGLATAVLNGEYPQKGWARNNAVNEMYFVVSGSGLLRFREGDTLSLVPDSAALIRRGEEFRVEQADELYVVVPTSPAWTPDQSVVVPLN